MERKVALITGGNTGIGLAVAKRLLMRDPNLRICLACRNPSRAEAACSVLKTGWPDADISVLIIDVSCLESVYIAAEEIKKRYSHLDYLYLNAGIMPVSSFNWSNFWNGLFSRNAAQMFLTGHGLLTQADSQTNEGLQQVFTTNVFGHTVLIKEIEDVLGGSSSTTQIIWTSSSNAKKSAFCLEDIQHAEGDESYASSKYAADCVNVVINEKLNKNGVYSHSTCPGLVMTNLTYGIMPSWIWNLFLPILWMIRLFSPTMNISPENGAEALVWLSEQKPESLDPYMKYRSQVSFLGNKYVEPIKMDINSEFAHKVYDAIFELEKEQKSKLFS